MNGVNPVADFEVVNSTALCSKDVVSFINRSYVTGFGDVTRLEWYFDYLNQPSQVLVDENPTPNKVYTFKYPTFNTNIPRNYSVRLLAYSGGVCVSLETIKVVTVKGVPQVSFSTLADVCQEITPFQLTQASELFSFSGTYRFTGAGVSSWEGLALKMPGWAPIPLSMCLRHKMAVPIRLVEAFGFLLRQV